MSALREQLEELLAESPAAAAERERTEYDRVAGDISTPIVLFGAARLGQLVLKGLRQNGVEPAAFADNNATIWGSTIEGVPVLSPVEAGRRFGDNCVFVIAIWGRGGSDRMQDRERRLRELGCRRVVTFGTLFWKFPAYFLPRIPALDLPHKALEKAEDIRTAFQALSDERSREEFVAQLRWRVRFDFDALPEPVADPIYWPPVTRVRDDEVYVDCGAYDGDTITAFLKWVANRFRQVIAFEPDPVSLARLHEKIDGLDETVRTRVRVVSAATGAHASRVRFAATGELGSAGGQGNYDVPVVTLDDELRDVSPTYIKMDIEGAECDTLCGARDILRRDAPVLAICAYHVQDHLWKLPCLIRSLNPDYRIYLRPHVQMVEDLVCYAIPPQRSVA